MTQIPCALQALLLTILATFSGIAVADDRTAQEYYQEGLSAYQRDDVVAAMALLEKAVAMDDTRAQVLLAGILDKAEEDARAVELYQLAADKGDPEGELGLGSMYAAGEGVERDYAAALYWIERAAEQGLGPAIVLLADAYSQGQLGLEKDQERAIVWLKKGSASGYEPARQSLEKLERDSARPTQAD
jgi:TPR repeat protein